MKTDRELLELAAKAAGVEVKFDKDCAPHIDDPIGGVLGWWDPLTDDGDALRLMVEIGITPHFHSEHSTTLIVVDRVKDPEGLDVLVKWDGDKHRATRRAIVLAAAKIGEGM